MKHIWLLISFLYACLNTFSHPKCNYYFEQIMIADGLSQNHITCIHQDAQGFIWFGTQNGLNKYDGYQIGIYFLSMKIKTIYYGLVQPAECYVLIL